MFRYSEAIGLVKFLTNHMTVLPELFRGAAELHGGATALDTAFTGDKSVSQ